jgi:hypothetical protein
MSDHQHTLACLEEVGGQLVCRVQSQPIAVSSVQPASPPGIEKEPGYCVGTNCPDKPKSPHVHAPGEPKYRSGGPLRPGRPISVPFNLDRYADLCPKHSRKGKTKEQKAALGYYTFCLREEDRYGGSVFVRPGDRRSKELAAKSTDASNWCKAVGIRFP